MVGCSDIEGNMRGSRLRAFAEAAKIATGRDACLLERCKAAPCATRLCGSYMAVHGIVVIPRIGCGKNKATTSLSNKRKDSAAAGSDMSPDTVIATYNGEKVTSLRRAHA